MSSFDGWNFESSLLSASDDRFFNEIQFDTIHCRVLGKKSARFDRGWHSVRVSEKVISIIAMAIFI